MPKIINAYADGNNTLAAGLDKLAESIFGDGAKNEVYRQTAIGKRRENENIPLIGDAITRHDFAAAVRAGINAGIEPKVVGGYGQYYDVNTSGAGSKRALDATMAVPGANYGNTVQGVNADLANRRSIADLTSQRAADERKYEFQNTPEVVKGADGVERYVPRTAAMNQPAGVAGLSDRLANERTINDMTTRRQQESERYKADNTMEPTLDPATGHTILVPRSQAAGHEAPQSTDQVAAGVMRKAIDQQPQQPAQTPFPAPLPGQSAAPAAAPAAPADPFANVPPAILKKSGLYFEPQSYVDPTTGRTGISHDGGHTVVLPNGQVQPVTGGGWQPVGHETALAQARDNIVRDSVASPPAMGNGSNSQAAADAAATSGMTPFVTKHVNAELGSVPVIGSLMQGAAQYLTGSPEIGASTERARSRQDIRNNEARSVLLGSPGRQSVQAQKWVNDLLPQGAALTNPETERQKIPTIVNALKADYEQVRQLVADPATQPAERVKYRQQLHQIENTLRLFTEPEAGGAPAPAAAPAGGKPQTVIQNGHTYTLQPDGSYQ